MLSHSKSMTRVIHPPIYIENWRELQIYFCTGFGKIIKTNVSFRDITVARRIKCHCCDFCVGTSLYVQKITIKYQDKLVWSFYNDLNKVCKNGGDIIRQMSCIFTANKNIELVHKTLVLWCILKEKYSNIMYEKSCCYRFIHIAVFGIYILGLIK